MDECVKIDGMKPAVVSDKVRTVLKQYLHETRVTMGDGSISNKICTLCEGKVPMHAEEADDCACQKARKLLSGYL